MTFVTDHWWGVTSVTPGRPHPPSAALGFECTTLSWSHAKYLFHSDVTDSTKVTVTQWGLLLNNSWPVSCEMTTQHLRPPSAEWSRLSPMNLWNLDLRILQLLRGVLHISHASPLGALSKKNVALNFSPFLAQKCSNIMGRYVRTFGSGGFLRKCQICNILEGNFSHFSV